MEQEKAQEEEAPNTNLPFGNAIRALKEGKIVSRSAWDGSWKFIFKQVPATIGRDIIPKMQSLPDEVKEFLLVDATRVAISYEDQICMMDERGLLVNYTASASDILAEDWCIH